MKNFVRSGIYFLALFSVLIVPSELSYAQTECDFSGSVTLDIQLDPIIETSSVLSLGSLGVDSEGFGRQIATGIMRNETDQLLDNLFLEFSVDVGSKGKVAELTQRAAYPFSLEPNQVIYATNNDIKNEEIPGIEERLKFDGGLTPEGEQFVEDDIGGTTTLPSDLYTITVNVYRVTNACGKVQVAQEVVSFGGGISNDMGTSISEDLSIFLRTPGGEEGSGITITNQYPQLSWEGDANVEYRVIVVRDDPSGDAQSLLESAKDTEADNPGTLLPFEFLDQTVTGASLIYPESGTQRLNPGDKYYWQVSTIIPTSTGDREVVSEIWNFTLVNPASETTEVTQEISQETINSIITLIGQDLFDSYQADGFVFEGIEMDDVVFSGITGLQKLEEILQKIEDGEIIISDN